MPAMRVIFHRMCQSARSWRYLTHLLKPPTHHRPNPLYYM